MESSLCKFCNKRSNAAETLDNAEMEKLGHSCVQVNFSKGDIIFKQNSLSSNIIYIMEGIVKVHLKGPAREQILKISKGPSYLGIPTTFGDKINNYSATAISEVLACFIDINTFKEFIAVNSNFAFEIIVDLCKDELDHFRRCINQSQKQSAGRIAEAILIFANQIFVKDTFFLPINQSELGDLTGSSRENVSRILNDFAKDNIIRIKGKELSILDKTRLEQISKTG